MQDLPIFYAPNIRADKHLPETEGQHCLRVLRMNVGDDLLLTDGKGDFFKARITQTSKKTCQVEILEEYPWTKTWRNHLTLCVVPTKSMDRMEWLLEKAVEVGVDRVICPKTKHSERKHIKAERLEKIMLSAMKQSQKAILPELFVDVPFQEALQMCGDSQILIAHCRAEGQGLRERKLIHHLYEPTQSAYSLFIGPEGDFTQEEIMQAQNVGAKAISLGANRLRTETAGLVALNTLHLLEVINDDTQE